MAGYDPWRPARRSAGWDARSDEQKRGAFSYFAELTPIAKVGHSIFLYELTRDQCDRINPRLTAPPPQPIRAR